MNDERGMLNGESERHIVFRSSFIVHRSSFSRSARTEWAVLAFLIGFSILLVGVSDFYLLPASEAFVRATPHQREMLIAHARLLLSLILLILFCGLVLSFRIGRFFFPRKSDPRTRTKYVDVWAEAGKRATDIEPADEDDEDEDDE